MSAVALVFNPDSGTGGAEQIGAGLRELGAEVTEIPIDRAAEAVRAGAERIAVAGGDGSIAAAAEAASRCGLPLAVVAAGTANDFVRRMDLPSEPAEAMRLIVDGTRSREVDLARIGERPFVNVASLGLAPAAAESAEELKQVLGPLAYSVGAVRAAAVEEPFHCRVRCDGEELIDGHAWQLTIGCSGAFGGGARIETDADDGLLDAVVIESGPRVRLAKHAVAMRSGGLEAQRGVRTLRCREVEIDAAGAEAANVDGEIVALGELAGEEGTLRVTVRPRAFRLLVG